MEIKLARTAGFCFGVKRAVEMAEKCIKNEKGPIYMLGPVIHNRIVMDDFLKQGARVIESLSETQDGAGTVIIRAHGIPEAVYNEAEKKDIKLLDLTCPFVKKIHSIASEHVEKGHEIIIIGDKNHPEVIGINGWCGGKGYIFGSDEELENYLTENPEFCKKKICMVTQTTFNRKLFDICQIIANKLCTNIIIFDTICNATDERQSEARKLSHESQMMLIIGSEESSNSRKLYEVSKEMNDNVHFIESANDLTEGMFSASGIVGITAGASTPAFIIKEVIGKMEQAKNLDNMELDFEAAFEQSFKTLTTGDIVKGMVVGVAPNEIHVDLGTKHDGYIPISELTDQPDVKADELLKIGDEIEVFVVRVNDVEGTVMLSKKRVDSMRDYQDIEKAFENEEIMPCTIISAVKGGVIALVKAVRVFVPASLASDRYTSDLQSLVGRETRLKIIEINRERRRITGSIKAVLESERKEKSAKVWDEIEEGKTYEGTVKSLAAYGAFVDIGGVDGMVHISELSWKRIKHPSEVLAVDDKVEVYILSFDKEKRKISLGYKKSDDNPWKLFAEKYSEGDAVNCRIVKFMPFGAFAEVIPGIDGLIHISQISNSRIGKPSDVLMVGQHVDVKITGIDLENKKVNLSIRALSEDSMIPEESEETKAEQLGSEQKTTEE